MRRRLPSFRSGFGPIPGSIRPRIIGFLSGGQWLERRCNHHLGCASVAFQQCNLRVRAYASVIIRRFSSNSALSISPRAKRSMHAYRGSTNTTYSISTTFTQPPLFCGLQPDAYQGKNWRPGYRQKSLNRSGASSVYRTVLDILVPKPSLQ